MWIRMLLASIVLNRAIDESTEWSRLALFGVESLTNTVCINMWELARFNLD